MRRTDAFRNWRISSLLIGATALLMASPSARAEVRPAASPITVGVEIGGFFPQPLSKLGTSFNATLELGYLLPIARQRLQLYVGVGYTQPSHSGGMTDPRLPGAAGYEITEQELLVNLGVLYRLSPPRSRLNFYGQLGLRIDLQRSSVNGNVDGAAFGENQETATQLGAHAAVGAEYMLGPGALAAELDLGISKLSQFATGESTAGGVSLLAGYHLFF